MRFDLANGISYNELELVIYDDKVSTNILVVSLIVGVHRHLFEVRHRRWLTIGILLIRMILRVV